MKYFSEYFKIVLDKIISYIIMCHINIRELIMNVRVQISRHQSQFIDLEYVVPKDHIIRLADTTIDLIIQKYGFLSEVKNKCYIQNRKSYNPVLLFKVLVYGYIYKTPSSRALEEQCRKDFYLKWFVDGIEPSYRTLCYFRENNAKLIEDFFYAFISEMTREGIVKLEKCAIDGMKVKGNVSKKFYDISKLEKKKEILQLENEIYLKNFDNENNIDIKKIKKKYKATQKRLSNINRCLLRINNTNIKKLNFCDPEASSLNNHGHHYPGYNAQAISDSDSHMIVSISSKMSCNDFNEVVPEVKKFEEKTGLKIKQIVADKGYASFKNIVVMEDELNIDFVTRLQDLDPDINNFKYNEETDIYTCQKGKELKFHQNKIGDNGKKYIVYKCHDCKGCEVFSKCSKSKTGKSIYIHLDNDREMQFRAKMDTPYYRNLERLRKGMIENKFGTLRNMMGYIPLLLRGTVKTGTELYLYALAFNLKRLKSIFRNKKGRTFFIFLHVKLRIVNFYCKKLNFRAIWQKLCKLSFKIEIFQRCTE